MMNPHSRQRQARVLRAVRTLHRWTGISLFLFMAWIGITGGLLGWKKNSGGLLLAPTEKGSTSDLAKWLPLDSLQELAGRYLHAEVAADLSKSIDRMEVRPERGVVKFTFRDHFWGVQIDGATGALLRIERRNADLVEQLHDGSLVDRWLGTDGRFKLFYTSVMSLALLVFSVSGFWLWYGPRRMRVKARHG